MKKVYEVTRGYCKLNSALICFDVKKNTLRCIILVLYVWDILKRLLISYFVQTQLQIDFLIIIYLGNTGGCTY